jgi:hypothetical protein
VKGPDCLDAVLLAKQVDRRHDSRLDKSPSVWTLACDVVATVDSTKVDPSQNYLNGIAHLPKLLQNYLHCRVNTMPHIQLRILLFLRYSNYYNENLLSDAVYGVSLNITNCLRN